MWSKDDEIIYLLLNSNSLAEYNLTNLDGASITTEPQFWVMTALCLVLLYCVYCRVEITVLDTQNEDIVIYYWCSEGQRGERMSLWEHTVFLWW